MCRGDFQVEAKVDKVKTIATAFSGRIMEKKRGESVPVLCDSSGMLQMDELSS